MATTELEAFVDTPVTSADIHIDFSKVEADYRHLTLANSVDVAEVDQELVDQAFQVQTDIINIIREAGKQLAELGKRLIPFRDEKMWQYLGYDSFAEWYQDMGLSKSTVYRAMNIYEYFILDCGLSEEEVYNKDIRKLDRLLPLRNTVADGEEAAILTADTADEWISKCELSEPDLIREISEAKGQLSENDRLVDEGLLFKGCYVLVKTSERTDEMELLSEAKVKGELYKNTEGDLVLRVV